MKREYRKKPVVIEAFFFGLHTPPQWFRDAVKEGVIKYIPNESCLPNDVIIETLEVCYTASQQRDYIIKGIKGEIYPCKADIFELTYEEVSK